MGQQRRVGPLGWCKSGNYSLEALGPELALGLGQVAGCLRRMEKPVEMFCTAGVLQLVGNGEGV